MPNAGFLPCRVFAQNVQLPSKPGLKHRMQEDPTKISTGLATKIMKIPTKCFWTRGTKEAKIVQKKKIWITESYWKITFNISRALGAPNFSLRPSSTSMDVSSSWTLSPGYCGHQDFCMLHTSAVNSPIFTSFFRHQRSPNERRLRSALCSWVTWWSQFRASCMPAESANAGIMKPTNLKFQGPFLF